MAGTAEIVTAFDDWKRSEVQLWTPGFGNLVAQAQLSEGNIDAAMDVVTDELVRIEETGLRQFSFLLLKTQGDIHCAAGRLADAGRCYQSAIDTALSQSAKLWELCLTTSLARLWQAQGQNDEVCKLLAPIYDWFTEGLDTADLKEAKALLDELS